MVIPLDRSDGSIVAIEPWEQNKLYSWPDPHLQEVYNKQIKLVNNTNKPIHLGKDVKLCKIRSTNEMDIK